jgi:hypothetical protein
MTALFVERDASYFRAVRRVRYAVEPGEYLEPTRRPRLLARIIAQATEALRSEDETVIAPAPVILELDEFSNQLLCQYDYPNRPRLILPHRKLVKTTYARYAEVLPHLEFTPEPKPELDRQTLYVLANASSALRARLLDVIASPAGSAMQPKKRRDDSGLIDLRLRLIIQRRDYRVIASMQGTGEGKLITSAGLVE